MNIETATHLWIESGEMSGGSRNQIEFSDDLIRFFDEKSRELGKVFIAFDNNVKAYCPLANRAKDYGPWSDIWRLGLITEDKGGVSYPGRVIHFERRLVGRNYVYLIEVVNSQSSEYEHLVATSATTGITGGSDGRHFGYW